jgi:hypothetical protein
VRNLTWGSLFGLLVGLFFAFLVAWMNARAGQPYWLEIMLPGSIVGLIVGYATQRYGVPRAERQAA